MQMWDVEPVHHVRELGLEEHQTGHIFHRLGAGIRAEPISEDQGLDPLNR